MMRMLAWCGISQSSVGAAAGLAPAPRAAALVEHPHGQLEHRLAVHLQRTGGRAPRRRTPCPARAGCRHGGRRHAGAWTGCRARSTGLQHHRAGAVAEQHAGARGRSSRAGAKTLRHRPPARTWRRRCGSNLSARRARRRSRVQTACTSKAGAAVHAELVLQQAGGRRKHHVRRGRGDDDQVDLLGATPAASIAWRAGVQRQIAGAGAVGRRHAAPRMPVRSTIHSSVVSTPRAASSATRSALLSRAAAGNCRCR